MTPCGGVMFLMSILMASNLSVHSGQLPVEIQPSAQLGWVSVVIGV